MSWSSFSPIDSAICFDAPRRLDFGLSPRSASSEFGDLAGRPR